MGDSAATPPAPGAKPASAPASALASSGELSWEREGRHWPNRDSSRFVRASGLRWHVQRMGRGPAVVLLHGTGASTHSWRALAPLLAPHLTVVALDLPGHGFTQALPAHRRTLPGMARAVSDLLHAMDEAPALAAGHSAGAAVLLRMCLDGRIEPRAVVAFNGALLPAPGGYGGPLAPVARLIARAPLLPRLFAWGASDPAVMARLLGNTGSVLDAEGAAFYARLARSPGQVSGALAMMAGWDLLPLERDLPRLRAKLVLVAGGGDRMVPPAEAERARALLPSAEVVAMPGLGHLAHEERPEEAAALLLRVAREAGVPA